MLKNGPRIGWTIGGMGSLIWMLAMAGVFINQGWSGAGMMELIFFLLGLFYLWFNAPWKRPDTRLWQLYGGLVLILALVAVYTAWISLDNQSWQWKNGWWLLFLFIFVFPAGTFGSRTWRDMHGDH